MYELLEMWEIGCEEVYTEKDFLEYEEWGD